MIQIYCRKNLDKERAVLKIFVFLDVTLCGLVFSDVSKDCSVFILREEQQDVVGTSYLAKGNTLTVTCSKKMCTFHHL